MKRIIVATAIVMGLSLAHAAPASARNYDCSKPGNANKAACKGTAKPAPKAVPSRTTTTKTTTTTTTRHYDCTKAGNANKAVCRTAAKESPTGKAPGAVKRTTTTATTTVDCGKWYNRMRSACKATSSALPPRTQVAPAPKPAPAATRPGNGKSAAAGDNGDPRGAIAQCRDGAYSHAATHRGACSHHGGIAKWLSGR